MMFNLAIQHWSLLAERLLLLLMDVSIKSVILVVAAGLLSLALRRASAAYRHLVWLLTLTATLCLPLFSALIPSHEVHAVSSAVRVQTRVLPAPTNDLSHPLPADVLQAPPPMAAVNGRPAQATLSQNEATAAQANSSPSGGAMGKKALAFVIGVFSLALSALWLLGVALLLGRMGIALLRLSTLRRSLVPLSSEIVTATIAQVVGMTAMRRPIHFFQAKQGSGITVPLTWGWSRPIIVLPPDTAEWPEERLRAALLHEMAHVKRGDWLGQMLGSLACAVYWFNPLVWAASRAMRQECERTADDYALAHGLRASDYASHLVEIARAVQNRPPPPHQAVAMVGQSKFEHRLRAILARNSRQQVTDRFRMVALGLAAVLLLAASAFRFSSRAAGTPWASPIVSADASQNAVVADPAASQVALPNGVTVKLIGVADTQAQGATRWWTAQGLPVTEPLPKNTLVYPSLPAGAMGRAFAVGVTYNLAAQPKSLWTTAPNFAWSYARGGSDQTYYTKPNYTLQFDPDEHLQGLDHFQEQETKKGLQTVWLTVDALSSRSSVKTVTLRYAVAAGPWTESVTCQKTPGKVFIKTPSGDVIFTLITNPHHLPAAQAALGNARFMVSDHFRTPSPIVTENPMQVAMSAGTNYERTVLALDGAGRVVADLRGGLLTMPDGPQEDYRLIKTMQDTSISNALLKRIVSFRLLARPYQWAEFKNVQLQPSTSAEVAQSSSQFSSADTAAAHIALGQNLQQNGQPRDGIPEFRKAVQIDPSDAEAQYRLADALYSVNDQRVGTSIYGHDTPPAVLDEAIQHMKKAVMLQPDNPHWPSTLGTYLENRGRYAEAAIFFKRSLHLLGPARYMSVMRRITADGSGKAGEVYDNQWSLGDALLKTGQYREAAVHYQEALRFNPQADWVLLGYGDALHGTGRHAEARAAWKKLLAVSPPNPYYQGLARQRLAKP